MRGPWAGGEYKGRRDIWFRVAGRSCFGEAKHEWIKLPRPRAALDSLLKVLKEETDAAHLATMDQPEGKCTEIGMGILFITPFVLAPQISSAKQGLQIHYNKLRNELESWSEREHLHLVWGNYVRPELLEESGCYEWTNGKAGSCPSLDILICTRA